MIMLERSYAIYYRKIILRRQYFVLNYYYEITIFNEPRKLKCYNLFT